MVKKIKIPLPLKGVKVRDMETLKENFNVEEITAYFVNGKLLTWLEDRYYKEEAEKIRNLSKDDENLAKKLCEIFDVEYKELKPSTAYAPKKIVQGRAEIVERVSGTETYMARLLEGTISLNSEIRIFRNTEKMYDLTISSLQYRKLFAVCVKYDPNGLDNDVYIVFNPFIPKLEKGDVIDAFSVE